MKISNVSLAVSKKDVKEFFSFSGDIQYVEMRRSEKARNYLLVKIIGYQHLMLVMYHSETQESQVAFVTFNDPQGAETAMLLTVFCYACFGHMHNLDM